MDFDDIERRGLVLLGCGKMGGALLAGWIRGGLNPKAVYVLDPYPSDWLQDQSVHVNVGVPENPAFAVVAVKPQIMGDALPEMVKLGNGSTVFLSIAAGTTIARFSEELGSETPIVRSIPNTPAAIGQGITALIGNALVSEEAMAQAEMLLSVVGKTVRLTAEDQMDAVTAVSGSGPAYVFYLIETLAAAGASQGLSRELAMELALATVSGAGALAQNSDEDAATLRTNVTSPNGTTQAALEVLMNKETGFAPLLERAVRAATIRGKELGQ